MSEITIKCTLGGDLRRFTVSRSECSLELLKSRVASVFGVDASLRYHDSDGDLISLVTDEDLAEALLVAKDGPRGAILRLEACAAPATEGPTRVVVTQAAQGDEDTPNEEETPDAVEQIPQESTPVLEESTPGEGDEEAVLHEEQAEDVSEKKETVELRHGQPVTFTALRHIATGEVLPVEGKVLANGNVVFKLILAEGLCKGNTAANDKGSLLRHNGGEGVWAQWIVTRTDSGAAMLTNLAYKDSKWSLGLNPTGDDVKARLVHREGASDGEWTLLQNDIEMWPKPMKAAWPKAEKQQPVTFTALRHIATSEVLPVEGKVLANGRVVFKLVLAEGPCKGNTNIIKGGWSGPVVGFEGGEGPWAQWIVTRDDSGAAMLTNLAQKDKGISLGLKPGDGDVKARLVRREGACEGEWTLLQGDVEMWPKAHAWHSEKKAAKTEWMKAAKAEWNGDWKTTKAAWKEEWKSKEDGWKAEKKAWKAAKPEWGTGDWKAASQGWKAHCEQPVTFTALRHIATGVVVPVEGKVLTNGNVVFKLTPPEGACKGNTAMGPKGEVGHEGGEGPWAQWIVTRDNSGAAMLSNLGNKNKGWSLGLNSTGWSLQTRLVRREGACEGEWKLLNGDVEVQVWPKAPRAMADEKQAWKAAKAEWKEGWKAEKQAWKAAKAEWKKASSTPEQSMLATIVISGNLDGRTAAVDSHLAVHASTAKDTKDKHATWLMATSEAPKATVWSVVQGGSVPAGMVSLRVAGNRDGRQTCVGHVLQVCRVGKAPDMRDACSAYVVALDGHDKKGGLFQIEPCDQDPSLCMLRYAGNLDGRPDAQGWYLAAHNTNPKDARDGVSQYLFVTNQAGKASVFSIRPFWAQLPQPTTELDAMGNPKVGFHTAKKAALTDTYRAFKGLSQAPAEPAAPPTEESAAAALHALRVACGWVKKKTGLPIVVEEVSNEEALKVFNGLRGLDLPKWLLHARPGLAEMLSEGRVDAFVETLGSGMLELWHEKRSGGEAKMVLDAKVNFIEGATYEQIHLPEWAKGKQPDWVLGYGAKLCQERGAHGLFYQQHTNGHEIMGFYRTAEDMQGERVWHGHTRGFIATMDAAEARLKVAKKAEKQVAKEAEKAEKELAKATAKAEKEAAKEAAKAEKEAAKEAAKAEKEAAKEAAKAEKEAAKEAAKAEKEAAKEAAKAEKEAAKKAEKEAAKAAKQAAKEAAKAVPALDLMTMPDVPEKKAADKTEMADESDELMQQLEQLNRMGFGTPTTNRHALAAANGNLEVAVDILLTSDYSMVEADGEGATEVPPPSFAPPSYRSMEEEQ
jgi:hypothetical protein